MVLNERGNIENLAQQEHRPIGGIWCALIGIVFLFLVGSAVMLILAEKGVH